VNGSCVGCEWGTLQPDDEGSHALSQLLRNQSRDKHHSLNESALTLAFESAPHTFARAFSLRGDLVIVASDCRTEGLDGQPDQGRLDPSRRGGQRGDLPTASVSHSRPKELTMPGSTPYEGTTYRASRAAD
jgi:hypothetical protein